MSIFGAEQVRSAARDETLEDQSRENRPARDESGEETDGAVVQRGFSGSAVFLQDGSVVGVLVQCISFPIDLENLSWGRYVLPLISPVYEIRDQIAELLAGHPVNHFEARI